MHSYANKETNLRQIPRDPEFIHAALWLDVNLRMKKSIEEFLEIFHQKPVRRAAVPDQRMCLLGCCDVTFLQSSHNGSKACECVRLPTYVAPECYAAENSPSPETITQAVDVWSLGCVYSEAVTWTTYGYPRLQQYRRENDLETRKIPGFTARACFHNEEHVLPAVKNVHATIIQQQE